MTPTDNLREQIAQAFDNAFEPSGIPNVDASRRHSAHKYSAQCYVCDGDITKLADTAASVVIPTLDAQRAEIERLTRDLAKMQEVAAGAYTIPTATEQGVEERLRETLAPYLDNFPEGEAGEILPSIMHVIVPVLSHQQAAHRRDLVRNANKTKILCAELENTQRELDALRNERNTPPDSPTEKDNVADTQISRSYYRHEISRALRDAGVLPLSGNQTDALTDAVLLVIDPLLRELSYLRGGTDTGPQSTETTPGGFPYRQFPHPHCGSNADRQPGHCEDCVSVGHVVAHPELGCGDVGCYSDHTGESTHPHSATAAPPSGR